LNKSVPEWQTVLDFNAARHDVGGGGANLNRNTCKASVRSPTPEYQHSVFTDRMSCLPPNQQRQSTEAINKELQCNS